MTYNLIFYSILKYLTLNIIIIFSNSYYRNFTFYYLYNMFLDMFVDLILWSFKFLSGIRIEFPKLYVCNLYNKM